MCMANPSTAKVAQEPSLTSEVLIHLVGDGTVGPYRLKDHQIVMETDTIQRNGILLSRGSDYSIDYSHGQVTFSAPIYPTDSLEVRYEKLNLNLRRKYFHRELVFGMGQARTNQAGAWTGEREDLSPAGSKWDFLSRKGPSDLTLSGSKTFSFELGSSQDLSVKQGLQLSAKGRATGNLEILLQLSDQNMPALPQGTSKRLEELDKVQILVKSPNFSGTLGDYYLRSTASGFSSFEKKLKGVTAEARAGKNSASFALASSRGEYFSNAFQGEESKQGPYHLAGKQGETKLMILPGTERVWVDGEEIQRGSNNDYTIDYSRGTIEFTPRRLITSDSRITVDFEYSVENYRRDLYGGDLFASIVDGRVELKASGIFEQDNRGHPSTLILSSEDKQILSAAGNERLWASKEGAVYVGEGAGEYDLAYDSSGNTYYLHTGSDSGSYDASFSWVGQGEGSYQYRGGGIYQYVYLGNGDYLPVVLLPLPESHSLFDLSLSLLPTDALETEIEWAKSKKDKNTFSQTGDEHNWGDAVSVKSSYRRGDFQFFKPDFHKLEIEAEYRSIGQDFAPFGRMDQVEKSRRWGLLERSISADEKTYQLKGLIAPSESFLVDFDYGRLQWGEGFIGNRMSLGAEINPAEWISAKGNTERIRTREILAEGAKKETLWARNLFALTGRYKKLHTTFSWQRERRTPWVSSPAAERDNFDQLSGEVSLGLSNQIKSSTLLTYRKREGSPDNHSRSYSWHNRLSVRDLGGMLSSDLEITRRAKRYTDPRGHNTKQTLLVSRIDFYPPNQLVNVKFHHSQNQIYSSARFDSYLEVEEGKGDYRWEDGEYVPHPEGNFVRLSEWLGDTQPSLDLTKSIRLMFSPHKVSSGDKGKSFWTRAGKVLASDSFVGLRGNFTSRKSAGSYFLYPLVSLPNESILSQNMTVRHDLYLFPTRRSLTFRIRWEQTTDDDRLISDRGRHQRRLKQELLLKSRLSTRHFLESQIGREEINESSEGTLKNIIQGRSVTFGFTRRQALTLELKMAAEYKRRDEQIKRIGVEFYSLSPELIWSLLAQGRLRAQLRWIRLSSAPKEASLPYVLADGKRPGENYDWRLFLDYKWNRYLTTSVIYSGESIPTREAKHTARMEVKALF